MSGLLGSRPPVEPDDQAPSVITLEAETEQAVFETLSVGTARAILAELHRNPSVASDLADAVDSSLQNVSYHLDNLEAAGLVEVADQWYSDKGQEMDVYAPASGPLILVPEDEPGEEKFTTTDHDPDPRTTELVADD